MRWAGADDIAALRGEVRSAIDAWVESIRDGDLHRYLTLYADAFTYRGMTREQWAEYRVRTLGARAIEDFRITDVILLADPEEAGLFVSRFQQSTIEAGRKVVATKRLYWQRGPDGELRVVAEDNG